MYENDSSFRPVAGLCVLLAVAPWFSARAAETTQDKTVRLIYLVSKDREERSDFRQAIESAIQELQKWYGNS